jgi:hypothetical protein
MRQRERIADLLAYARSQYAASEEVDVREFYGGMIDACGGGLRPDAQMSAEYARGVMEVVTRLFAPPMWAQTFNQMRDGGTSS